MLIPRNMARRDWFEEEVNIARELFGDDGTSDGGIQFELRKRTKFDPDDDGKQRATIMHRVANER